MNISEMPEDLLKKVELLPNFISIKLSRGRENYELYVYKNHMGTIMVGYYPYKSVDGVDFTDIFFLDDRFGDVMVIKPNTSKKTLRTAYDRMVSDFEDSDIVALEAKEAKRQSDIFLKSL